MPRKRIVRPIRTFVPKGARKAVFSVLIDGEEMKNKLTKMMWTETVTNALSEAVITLANSSKEFTGKYSGGEVVEIKADYVDGTTTKFKGYLVISKPIFDRIPKQEITAYDFGYEAANRLVTEKYTTATDIGTIFEELVNEYLTGFTTTNVNTSTGVTATPIWQRKKLWECFKDLAIKYGRNNYDFYAGPDKDWHFFLKGSRQSTEDALVWQQNISRTITNVPFINKRNRITVIGKSIKGQLLQQTRDDAADQTSIGFIMEESIRDTNLTTLAEVKNVADNLIALKPNIGKNGTVLTRAGELDIFAGYKHFIYDPFNDLNAFFLISEVRHSLTTKLTTEVKFYERLPTELSTDDILRQKTVNEQERLDIENEFNMDNTFPVTFDNEEQIDTALTDSNIGTLNARLILESGTTGTFYSTTEEADENITQVVFKASGSDFEDCTFQISVDGGASVETVTLNTVHNVAGTGKNLKLIIIFSSTAARPNPSFESLNGLYK